MKPNSRRSVYPFISFKWINKYFIATLLFLVWIVFFDKNNLINQYKLSNSVNNMENEKLDYLHKLELAKEEKTNLEENKERYAREKYYMHKNNEDIFRIERESE